MTFEGHVDFYGRLPEVAGTFFGGWSSSWRPMGEPIALSAEFERGSIATFDDYLVAFYPRTDLGDRGCGFVLLLSGRSTGLGEFVSLKIDFTDAAAAIVPTPRPPEFGEEHLRAELSALLKRADTDTAATLQRVLVTAQDVPTAGAANEPSRSPAAAEDARSLQIDHIRTSGLFDFDFYGETYGDVAGVTKVIERFVDCDCAAGRKPNLYFAPLWYLETYTDVAEQSINPLYHYAKSGEIEGRRPCIYFDPVWYRERYGLAAEESALAHYLRHRRSCKFSPIPEFDVEYYARTYPDIAQAGIDPFEHYLNWGYKEGRNPSEAFNNVYYIQRYLHGNDTENPLVHFLEHRGSLGTYERLQSGEATAYREIKHFTSAGQYFEDFSPMRGLPKRAKVLAYYLPQFHAFPENDSWWGRGFTEWTNLARGVPRFKGHYQPRIPRDLGFYSLDGGETLRRQVEMAVAAGLYGFVFYYYWFNGKRLLHGPLEQFLADPRIEMPFCLMWANENWTRRWDGSEHEILISQDYCPGDDDKTDRGFGPSLP